MFRPRSTNLANSQNACIEVNHNFSMYNIHEQIVHIIWIKDIRIFSVLYLSSSIWAKVFIFGNVYITLY